MFLVPPFRQDPLEFPEGLVTGEKVAHVLGIEPIAVAVEGKPQDLSQTLPPKATLKFIFPNDPEGLEILRHTAAHILAQAVKELYPDVQVTIGPVIEDGFYYDFYREESFSEKDLDAIHQRMQEIVRRNEPIQRELWSRQEAIEFFRQKGELFKVKIIEDIDEKEQLSLYRQGAFVDLCRGPHLPSTGRLGASFKLTKISGAYWRGNAKNPQLQRIYGTAWATEEDLQNYLNRIQEAEKRDHRRLGHDMDLFHFQEEAPGSVFWHAHGWTLYCLLQNYVRQELAQHGYQEVNTPQLVDKSLWEASGHWAKFRDNMFTIAQEERSFGLKPMNCPCHIQIFNHKLHSYRDLPLRIAEFGSCMRNESSGSRAGLMRVTSFVQDDAHIFCMPGQVTSETTAFCHLLFKVYRALGFEDIIIRLATRPEMRLGDESVWDHAEEALKEGAKAANLEYTLLPGEGAFYGPKLEFALKDSLGRLWQCGTLQVDFILPERLGAYYVGPDGEKHRPVMLHRAILGSMERFIGVLLEHTGGCLPLWLAPVQVVVISLSEKTAFYAQQIAQVLKNIRVEVDIRNEKLGYKIREHTLKKVPLLCIVGPQEEASQTVTLRSRGVAEQETVSLDQLATLLQRKGAFL